MQKLTTLFPECVLISYDCEANNPDKNPIIPGSCMALGAAAFVWSNTYAQNRSRPKTTPAPFLTFGMTMKPEAPMSPQSAAFWAKHPQALEWCTNTATPIEYAFTGFILWVLATAEACNLPAILVAAPHDYDYQHVEDAFNRIPNKPLVQEFLATVHFADAAELYATHHNLPMREGKTEFTELFMPQMLVHEPVFDSLTQLSAIVAGLTWNRPPITP